MKRLYFLILLLPLFILNAEAQFAGPFRTSFYDPDTLKRPFKALGMSLIPDVTVFSVNRFIKHSDFAYIDAKSIYDNFMFTSLWDNDMFGTNLLAHPFHGSLDYNGARVSGMNYWQCFPYVFGASAIWELILENEPASFNDQLATSFGGMILGETSYRISSMIIDNEARGFERVVREIFGTLTSPMNGINRLLTGQMWKYKRYRTPNASEVFPVNFGVDLSAHYLRRFDNQRIQRWSPFLHGWINYGDPFRKENMRPLDYFQIEFTLDLFGKNSILSSLEVVGLLYGKEIEMKKKDKQLMWGVFQHFVYMEKENMGADSVAAMRYSEPASVGLGLEYKKTDTHTKNEFSGCFHLNAVILGAAQATQFKLKGREYNFGQGYSTRLHLKYNMKDKFILGVKSSFSHLFTWKGYQKGIVTEEQNPATLNAMGDKGNTTVTMVMPFVQWNLSKYFSINLNTNFFLQHNHNCDIPDSHYYYQDSSLGLKYIY
ncbi:MAG: DUF3943 domain-containing protein [Bacteroidales bacterium]